MITTNLFSVPGNKCYICVCACAHTRARVFLCMCVGVSLFCLNLLTSLWLSTSTTFSNPVFFLWNDLKIILFSSPIVCLFVQSQVTVPSLDYHNICPASLPISFPHLNFKLLDCRSYVSQLSSLGICFLSEKGFINQTLGPASLKILSTILQSPAPD